MYRGSIVALVTPFKTNFEIDFEAYGRLIDFQLEHGTHGIVPCGCTGEAATLSHAEQKQCVKFTIDRVAGRVPVIAGTGSNNTKEAIDLTAYAKEVGADGALLITPYYNKPTPAGQIAHYRTIAEQVDIPIMLYNVPSRTGTKMSPETIAALNEIPNIVSIKEACGSVDQVTQILAQCDINVVSGDDALALPMMSVGATGVVFPSMAAGEASREITIVAKNMAFVIESPESSGQANPTITVKTGQKITIVLRNDDPGMQHDLVIKGLEVEVEVTSFGETTRLTFTAPREPGAYVYLCSFHPMSMRGVFIVE